MSPGDRQDGFDRRQFDTADTFDLRKSTTRGLPLLAGQQKFALVFARQIRRTCSTFAHQRDIPNVLITAGQKVSIGTNPNSPGGAA